MKYILKIFVILIGAILALPFFFFLALLLLWNWNDTGAMEALSQILRAAVSNKQIDVK